MALDRIESISTAVTLKFAEKAELYSKRGIKVIRMDIGQPNFNTPRFIIEAAYTALKRGLTSYSSSRGLELLRQAIAGRIREKFKVDVKAGKNIIITPGAKYAVYSAIMSIAREGDEILCLTPCWVSYEPIIRIAGCKPILIKTIDMNFKPNIDSILNNISKKTKAIVINTPNNPTGIVYDYKTLKELVEIAEDYKLYIISDEIYDELVYEGRHHSVLEVEGVSERIIYVNSFSKTFSMTGWRLGYIVASENIVNRVEKFISQTITCVPPFIQYAGYVALTSSESQRWIEYVRSELNRRRLRLYNTLKSFNILGVVKPIGAYYFFVNIAKTGLSSEKLCSILLDRYGIACIPGKYFGGWDNYIRISYGGVSMNDIEEFHDRFKRALDRIIGGLWL